MATDAGVSSQVSEHSAAAPATVDPLDDPIRLIASASLIFELVLPKMWRGRQT